MAKRPKLSEDPAGKSGEQGGGFLARWSRRKGDARTEKRQPVAAEEPLKTSATAAEPVAPKTDADMPPLETLDERSDYSDFLSPGVSEKLRQAALRKLFHLPHLNVVDGLDDYAEDYTVFAPLGDIVTADMRYRREVEEQRARERQRELEASEETTVAKNEQAIVETPEPAEQPQAEAEPLPADEQEQKRESSQEKG